MVIKTEMLSLYYSI